MHLLSLTINKSGLITKCIQGNFTGSRKLPELVVIRGGHILELLKLDETMRLQTVVSTDAFGCLRTVQPFRLPGSTKDYIVIGSDSGRITILEYDSSRNQFSKVHMETFGRSGCRRIVPGEYLASDPRGRAVMIGAIEKQKLVYVLSRDTQSKLTISSPLEAHKSNTVLFDLCGVDVGFDNPIFAALEFDYTDVHSTDPSADEPQKVLTYYELDLGLNHVSRRWNEPVDNSANALVPCPGWKDGPGGVLVCSAGWVSWHSEGKTPVGVPLPRRAGEEEEGEVLVLTTALHKTRGGFFIMLQSELGDLYRVSLEWHGDIVTGIEIAYLDTAPIAATMAVLRNGYLFLAPEAGPQHLYRILGLGTPPTSSSQKGVPTFTPSIEKLINLEPADELSSLCPMTDTRVRMAGGEEAARIYALCGRGSSSALRILRHGLVASQVGSTDLKKEPTGVWTIPTLNGSKDGSGDRYIILSFSATTAVLSVSGERMGEVQDSGLSTTVRTIAAGVLGNDDDSGNGNGNISAIVQVHPGGIRIVRAGGRAQEWQPGGHRQVRYAALNGVQVAVVLNDSELLYFELDTAGQLSLAESRPSDGAEIVAVALAPASTRGKGRFLAVADALSRVHILSLAPGDSLRPTAVQVLDDCAQSLAFEDTTEGTAPLHLCVGLRNGLLTRSAVDSISGALADTRIRLLGTMPVRLQQVRAAGRPALLALSSRSWLCCAGGIQSGSGNNGQYYMAPIAYVPLVAAAPFAAGQGQNGFVAVTESSMRVFFLDKLEDVFAYTDVPMPRTPRKVIVHPTTGFMISIETDHVVSTGAWSSALRVMESDGGKTLDVVEFDHTESTVSLCTCVFRDYDKERVFVIVGTASNLVLAPKRSCECGFISVYCFNHQQKLVLVHKTRVEDAPLAIAACQGRLLAGIGNTLRLYDMGKKQLLKKCERKDVGNMICQIHAMGERIVVGDVSESFSFAKYNRDENRIVPFADDIAPRWLAAGTFLDYDTIAGSDKFGNIFISRLPKDVTSDADEDPTGALLAEKTFLNGAPYRTECVACFHVGDTVTSLQKAALTRGGPEVLVYTTITGAIGALVPLDSREDVNFFQTLEMHMRAENPPLCGRDHLAYRSAYFPVKSVVDGDLCEQFASLPHETQQDIAQELERTPNEVIEKMADIRHTKLL